MYLLGSTRKVFPEAQIIKLRGLLPFWHTVIDNRRLLFLHGSPWDPLQGYVYPKTVDDSFGILCYDVIFMGHTHRPFSISTKKALLVNVGSCGLPRDVGTFPSFAVYDTETGEATIHRVAGDLQGVLRRYENLHPAVYACLSRGGEMETEMMSQRKG